MNRLAIALVTAAALLGVVGSASGSSLGKITDKYDGRLTPGQVVQTPKVESNGKGEFFAIYIKKPGVLVWIMRYGDLSGPATEAHIHVGPKGTNSPGLIRLCGPCRRPSRGEMRLTPAQLLPFMKRRQMYVTISTAEYPGGEIRGQLDTPPLREGCAPC